MGRREGSKQDPETRIQDQSPSAWGLSCHLLCNNGLLRFQTGLHDIGPAAFVVAQEL